MPKLPRFKPMSIITTEAAREAREISGGTFLYPQLTATNYTSWVIRVQAMMEDQGVWEAIEPTAGVGVDSRKDKKARSHLLQALPEDLLMQVAKKATAKEVWDCLNTRFIGADRVRNARLQTLKSDFDAMRMQEGESLDQYADRLTGMSVSGYMSPEYAMQGLFSIKSDVFSFGVLLLEIVSGQKNTSFGSSESSQNLLSHAWRLWRENRPTEMVDRELVESCEMREAVRCIHVGLLCVQEDPVLRPTMSLIVLMLTSSFLTLALPSAPAFCWGRTIMESNYSSDGSSTGLMRSDASGGVARSPWTNDVTISQLDAR